ncbi:MAG: hypothetical protein RBU29_08715, partial [bacterium]|nr:hypothetical protein [bacterium]
YPFQASNWHDGLSEAEAKREYQQVYDLAAYFLQTYNGSGKSFYFGHWEGDWWLLGNYDPKKDPSDSAVQGMIDWLAIRQKAVETARTTIAHENVQVWHYVEVNLVKKAMEGGKTITNNVLPNVTVDLVSYSAYDTIFDRSGGPAQLFLQALDTIESKARTTGHFPRDVFVGEYGFPLDQGKRTPEEQARLSEEIYTAALQWGCPFVLYWQMYDNEAEANGVNARGFWLIDAKNEKQPIYYKHRDFLSKAQIFIQLHRYWLGRNPSEAAYSAFCGNYKTFSASKTLDTILDSEEYQRRLSNADYLSWLWAHLFPTRDRDSAEYRDWLAMLDNGEARSTVLNHVLDFSFRQGGTAQTGLVTYLLDHTQDPMPAALREKEKNALQTTLDQGASPSQLWREILDRPHGAESMLDHRASEERDARWLERHLFFDPAQLHPTPSASLGERIE